MFPMPPLPSSGRLGITPSANSPTATDDESTTAIAETWYDKTCVPYARSFTSLMASWQIKPPEYLLLESIARMIETFSAGPATDEYTNAMRQMVLDGVLSTGKLGVCNHKAQLITKSMLLGQLCRILKCEPWNGEKVPRVPSTAKLHSRIAPIMKQAHTWASAFHSLKDQLETMRKEEGARILLPESELLTTEQQAHLRGLKILSGARRSSRQSVYSYVERNLQYLAFMVHWHSTHNTPFPHDSAVFIQQLSESTDQMGFSRQAIDFLGTMQTAAKEELHAALRTCFDLAVHISPLTLLANLPSQVAIIRGKLIDYGRELGDKPDYILKAEEAIWGAAMGIALGRDTTEQLQWLVRSHSAQFEVLEANADDVGRYFVNGIIPKKGEVNANTDVQMLEDNETTQMASPMEIDAQPENNESGAAAGPLSPPLNAPNGGAENDLLTHIDDGESGPPAGPSFAPLNALNGGTADDLLMKNDDMQPPRTTTQPAGPPAPAPAEPTAILPSHDAPDHTAIHGGGGRATPSSLSPLTDLEELPVEGTDLAPPASPKGQSSGLIVIPGGKFASGHSRSGRTVIPAVKYTSGASLTQPLAAAPKKRKLDSQGPTAGPMTVSMKEEELYWTSTLAYVTAAADDGGVDPAPAPLKTEKAGKAPPLPTQRSKESVSIPYFDESNTLGALEYTFQPDDKSAEFDIPLVGHLVRLIRAGFDSNGQPPHRQPAAAVATIGPDTTSSIFRVDCKRYNSMSAAEKQEIHRDRHVLITNVDNGSRTKFDEEGLETLTDLDEKVSFQYSDKKSKFNTDAMLQRVALRELLHHANSESSVAINALDFPLGEAAVQLPPSYSDIATSAYAANQVKGLVPPPDMKNVTSWGTAATANAVSWFHIDDDGFGTAVTVQSGKKWWVLARRKGPLSEDDMGDAATFRKWLVDDIDGDVWQVEGVCLDPTVALLMMGCTPHCVVGLENSIVHGRHYYSACTIRRHCFGLVHTLVLGYSITNIFHDDGTRAMIRQVMALWYRHFIIRDAFDRRDAHVPDIRTQGGLLDVIAVGCVLEYTTALSRGRYDKGYDSGTNEACALRVEENQARERFRFLMKVFGTKYMVQSHGQKVDVSEVWHAVMVQFAVAVVNYKQEKQAESTIIEGFTPIAMKKVFRDHLSADHPHLVAPFDHGLKRADASTLMTWPCLDWPLTIVPKARSFHHLMHAMCIPEQRGFEADDGPLRPTGRAPGVRSVADEYYGPMWPGEDLPNDEL